MRNPSLFLVFLLASATAWGQVEIENPWMRATAPGAKVAAGYMLIRNKASSPDRLISVSSPAAARVETHVTVKDGDISRMREVKGYDVPAKGSFELKPGGAHLMLIDPPRPLREGDKIAATLRFQRAGDMKVEFQVRAMGAGMRHMH